MRRAALAILVLAGCATVRGPVGFLGADPNAIATKLLVPGAHAESCRTSVVGVSLGGGEPSVTEAMAKLLARDEEANVVTDAEITWRAFVTGVYDRRCVEVRGNVIIYF